MRLFEHTASIQRGCNLRVGREVLDEKFSLQGIFFLIIPPSNLLKRHSSLDGDVKLWDVRGGSSSLDGWKMFPEGLSTFDMHDQCGVYAGQVVHIV